MRWPHPPFKGQTLRSFSRSRSFRNPHAPVGRPEGTIQGDPLFGGDAGIERAVGECGVSAVVVIDRGEAGTNDTRAVAAYLRREGTLDVFAGHISVGPALVAVSAVLGVS